MTDKIVQLRDVNAVDAERPRLQDIPACLRSIADAIEAGDHGDVARAAIVLRSADREPIVFGNGEVSSVSQTFEDLHAGALQLLYMTRPERS